MVACFLLVHALSSTAVSAHAQKTAFTKILFNSRTGNIEVMHRFYLHDAEHAANLYGKKGQDIISDPAARDAFAQYITGNFAVAGDDGTVLPLTLLGHETDGKFIWVYQEIADTGSFTTLTVRHNALREIWPDQTNTVNVERAKKTETITFAGEVELLTIPIPNH